MIATKLLLLLLPPLPLLPYYLATKYFATDIRSFRCVVELTTQQLILGNILWLPLCRINKFGLNTLPSKTIAIPYTCGLSKSTGKADLAPWTRPALNGLWYSGG